MRYGNTVVWMGVALLGYGCTCAASHNRDAAVDASLDAPPDAPVDAFVPPDAPAFDAGPLGSCQTLVENPDGPQGCIEPGVRQYCPPERCCYLAVICNDEHVLEPAPRPGREAGSFSCLSDPVQPECVLSAPNAELRVTIGDRSFELRYGYVEHGVGFSTSASMTFTATGQADVCSTQRVTVAGIAPFTDPDEFSYVGRYEIRFTIYDGMSTPPWRFVDGELEITAALPLPQGGPMSGRLIVDDGDVQIDGSFTEVAECLPWRTSGS